MEKEINIAEILKDKPKGLKLWSDTFGELFVDCIDEQNDAFPIYLTVRYGNKICLTKDGCYYSDETGTLPCIVPSKSMRDWSKFAWKKGDVLTDNATTICMFDSWANDDYTEFNAKYTLHLIASSNKESEVCKTNDFVPVVKDEDKQSYLATAETYFNVNLTKGSLWIEKPQFKDGDIVFVECVEEREADYIFICKNINNHKISDYCSLNINSSSLDYTGGNGLLLEFYKLRLATEEEKQQLFTALEKKGKRWNSETKTLEDLPKKCEFKPMDLCLMRDFNETWKLCQFGFMEKGHVTGNALYDAVGGNTYEECIPYNDKTAHLLGTTDDYEEGGDYV